MENVTKAMTLVARFNQEEWAEFDRRVKAFKSLDGKAPSTISKAEVRNLDADLILQTLCSTLEGMGVERTSPSMLIHTLYYNSFADKAPAVMAFIRGQVGTRTQQRALLSRGLVLLYENMTKAGYPVTARTMMNHIHRLPSIFNQHFPGYARSGMLGMLVKGENLCSEKTK